MSRDHADRAYRPTVGVAFLRDNLASGPQGRPPPPLPHSDIAAPSLCRLYCDLSDSGNYLVGGKLVANINVKTNGRAVNEIIADCCAACKAAAAKGCRKYGVIYNTNTNVAQCQLKSADAKVVPCGAKGCKYNNGAPGEVEYFQTSSMLPSKCSTNPGKPTATQPIASGARVTLVYKGLRIDATPFKTVTITTVEESVWGPCSAACAAEFALTKRCKAFNFDVSTQKCQLLAVDATAKKVSYCTDIFSYTGVQKPSKAQG